MAPAERKPRSNSQTILVVDGAVERPLRLSFEDLLGLSVAEQVADVSQFHPKRKGDGVTFQALLALARPLADSNYVTLHADRDDFHVSVPLDPLRTEGIVVYKLAGLPLGAENHGPIRFLVKDPAVCHTGELDDCANVKYLNRIEFTIQKGRDTRPTNDAEHEALHQREQEAKDHGSQQW